MDIKQTHYDILGVSFSATLAQIKDAYREKCKQHHPDVVGNTKENHELMCKINAAYFCLSNTQRRREYDSTIRDAVRQREAAKKAETDSSRSEDSDKEQRKEAPKAASPNYWDWEWFKSAPISNKPKFNTEEDYYDYIYSYYEENDYDKEQSESYITWLKEYIFDYKGFLNVSICLGSIEFKLYEEAMDHFEYIKEYTLEEYNNKYKSNYKTCNK